MFLSISYVCASIDISIDICSRPICLKEKINDAFVSDQDLFVIVQRVLDFVHCEDVSIIIDQNTAIIIDPNYSF